jgi:hypothetical protein
MGARPHDWFTVPLCRHCHDRQHAVGEEKFWKGVDAIRVAAALYLAPDLETCEQIIEANKP